MHCLIMLSCIDGINILSQRGKEYLKIGISGNMSINQFNVFISILLGPEHVAREGMIKTRHGAT